MTTSSRPKSPPQHDAIATRLRRTFWYGTAAVFALALTFALLYSVNRSTFRAVLKAREAARIARDARGLSVERQTGIRGFILARDNDLLQTELDARAALAPKLDSLLSLTSGRTSQHERAKAIKDAVGRWERGYALPALALTRAGESGKAAEREVAGKELFASVDAAFESFQSAEERLYQMRAAWVGIVGRFTLGAVLVELLLLLGILYWLRTRSIAQARNLVEQRDLLEDQKAELEAQAEELSETVTRLESAHLQTKQAESERAETVSMLDLVLSSSPVGFALLDSDLRFVRVNQALAEITGFDAEKHLGKRIDEIGSAESIDQVGPLMRRVLETGEPVRNVQYSSPKAGDPTIRQHKMLSLFRVGSGANVGIGCLVIDTTDRVRLEEQLLQAQKMEAIGRLAGGIAHDFNNMLTAMKSYTELLLADMDRNDPRRSDVSEIGRAADRATSLTRQLLAFSRQQVLRPQPIDLNQMVTEVQGMLRRLIGASTELTTRLDPDLGMVTADPGEIQRVIVNLVVNANDAMPDGGKLLIETANVELDEAYSAKHTDAPSGQYVMLAVTDNGHGMTRETQARLFEPFFTTKEVGKGTGLGLSSVYGIVKQSGGNIWVYSEPEQGTTFKIYLPRVGDSVAVPLYKVAPKRSNGVETILLVEDEDSVRAVASRILRREGYKVHEAANGTQALEICEREGSQVDLIVTDLVMPEIGGAELALKVRRVRPDARILFTSGYTQDAVVRQSFLEQGAAFIEKPFTPDALARKTREVLDAPILIPTS